MQTPGSSSITPFRHALSQRVNRYRLASQTRLSEIIAKPHKVSGYIDRRQLGRRALSSAVPLIIVGMLLSPWHQGRGAAVTGKVTVSGQSPNPVQAGRTATYAVTVDFNANKNSCTVSLRAAPTASPAWPLPPSRGFFTFTPASLTSKGKSTLTVAAVAGMPANTYQFTVTAEGRDCPQGSSVASATASLVVSAQSTSTTIGVAGSPSSIVFGQSVNFTAAVTPSIATGSIQFQIDGGAFGSPVPLGGGAAISGSISTLSVGPHTITATYTPTGGFAPSTGTTSLAVGKAGQAITFGALPGRVFGDPDFTVSASASSGLTVSFTASGNCTLNGFSTVHIAGAGSCTITAHQAGNQNYNAALDLPQTFTIDRATPVIAWATPADITYGTALGDAQLNATANLAGGFAYTPAAGTVLQVGDGQPLSVIFTPTDTTDYRSAGKTVYINVSKPGPDPTFVWVPDVHLPATSGTTRWLNQVNWIINNRAAWNIQGVFMSGDTQTPSMAWSQGTAPNQYGWFQIDALTPVLPWSSAIGNHDYIPGDAPAGRYDDSSFTNNMGADRLIGKSCFVSSWSSDWGLDVLAGNINDQTTTINVTAGDRFPAGRLIKIATEQMRVVGRDGNTLTVTRAVNGTTPAAHSLNDQIYVINGQPNYAIEFTVGSRTFLVIALELFPRPGAILWAGDLMKAHAKSEVIVITHGFLKTDGTPIAHGDTWGPNTYSLADNDSYSGVEMEEWLKGFSNIKAVFSGHYITTPYQAHRTATAADGHVFTEIFANYQSKPTTPSDSILLISLGATAATVRTMNTDTGIEDTTYTPYSVLWAPVN